MRYLDPERDEKVARLLSEAGLLTPRDWEGMAMPEEGHLLDVVIANGARLTGEWVTWLIRYHGMFRVAEPRWDMDTLPPEWEGHETLHRQWAVGLMREGGSLWVGRMLPGRDEGAGPMVGLSEEETLVEMALHPVEVGRLMREQRERRRTNA